MRILLIATGCPHGHRHAYGYQLTVYFTYQISLSNNRKKYHKTKGYGWSVSLEGVSKPQVRLKSKTQTDEKAQHTRYSM
jgi:hypothetical protein